MQTDTKINQLVKNQILILNQLFEIENKLSKLNVAHTINRNIDKLKLIHENSFDEFSFIIENPKGEKYNETRTDLEATIVGNSVNNLVVVDVIKPIIRIKQGKVSKIVQKGIVIVQDKNIDIKEEKTKTLKQNSLNCIKMIFPFKGNKKIKESSRKKKKKRR